MKSHIHVYRRQVNQDKLLECNCPPTHYIVNPRNPLHVLDEDESAQAKIQDASCCQKTGKT